MDLITEEQQLFRSCEILFGSQVSVSWEFLNYLQLSGLKDAYRKRAMETHPDRVTGNVFQSSAGNNESFHRVRKAYEQLCCYLKVKNCDRPLQTAHRHPAAATPPRKAESPSNIPKNGTGCSSGEGFHQHRHYRHATWPANFTRHARRDPEYSPTENLYCGPLPHRRLLFGHFLYYSGLANWRTITRILIWQRAERPRLGELGHRFGMLSQEDIALILQEKIPLQSFGETARRLGFLSEEQLRMLIFHQQRLQKKFGVILLEKNLLDPFELEELLFEFKRHNAEVLNHRGF